MKSSTRYQHPGDVIRLIGSGILLVAALVAVAIGKDRLLGEDATTIGGVEPSTAVGRLLVGLVQAAAIIVALAVVVAVLRRRRYRLLGSLVVGAVLAGALMRAFDAIVDRTDPVDLAANVERGGWLAGAAFPGATLLAGAVAVAVIVTRWLTAPWRRATWIALTVVAAARLVSGTILPMQLVIAFALGATVGNGLLVAFGAPDRRLGPDDVVAALQAGGFPAVSAVVAAVGGKGARPFIVTNAEGERFFVKILGQDQRDADLLYRAYRFLRLRNVGDVRPAASLKQAVEHQALVGMMAERFGVRVPRVHGLLEAPDGAVMLIMSLVHGASLADLPSELMTDELLEQLWVEVDRLHGARIAHRSLRPANIMVDTAAHPWIVDFSFSELGVDARALEVDVAELIASLASRIGPERSVASALSVVGAPAVASAVPLLQPLALSASTRREVSREEKLLTRTRAAAASASGAEPAELAPIRRVRAKTLLMIALAAGAFYFLLPQIAQVGDSFRAFQSAHWAWVPLVVVMSGLTYVAGAVGMIGTVPQRIPFGPIVNVQFASSFVNRVTPANVGGMAANARFLQKCGVEPGPAVAAVGLNSVVGAIVHIVLIVVFFVWSGSGLGKAFSLPSGSKILLILAVVAALGGVLFLTRWGRKTVFRPLVKGVRSAGANLAEVSKSPGKLAMLFGGSAGVTLAYIGALIMSVNAFGGGIPIAKIGAVYLAASALAAATPTPGGLGAIEAALVAGLTGVGMKSGPAVSTVLTYRLATYWLPILPGWASWWYLQRNEYL
ncbi:MAG TPA: lysylphosphatidylglycerol synthase transmembrane domain-containing protein [Ilumatobacteraceae bacterium]|nr:lysylphosphatidylglycerol synthase transmembrane domain-containing protein [Ilumatobacteraceae bacterium]